MNFKQWLNETFVVNGKEFRRPLMALEEIYNSHPNPQNLFVHFTNSARIGTNPKSNYYDTPTGIYLYPLDYVIRSNAAMPYASDRKYMQVVELKHPEKILHMTDTRRDMGMDYLAHVPPEQIKEVTPKVDELLKHISRSNYSRLWLTAKKIAKTTFKWNRLFRDAGIEGFYDHGTGTIHSAEPRQAVVFTNNAIKHLYQIDNINTNTRDPFDLHKLEPENLINYLKYHDGDDDVVDRFMLFGKLASAKNQPHAKILKNKQDALQFLVKHKPTLTNNNIKDIIKNLEYRPSPERIEELTNYIKNLRNQLSNNK